MYIRSSFYLLGSSVAGAVRLSLERDNVYVDLSFKSV